MSKRSTRTLLLAASICLTVAGCKKAGDIGALQSQAMELLGKFGPEISGLTGKIDGLKGKLGMMSGMDGASDLLGKLTGAGTSLGAMQGLLGSAKESVTAAVANKDMTAMTGLLDKLKTDVGDKLGPISKMVGEVETQVSDMEAKALPYSFELPDGTTIRGAEGGIESKLIGHITDADRAVDDSSWYDFDRLTFASGSAKHQGPNSTAQLANVGAILKAYPNAKIKVGGYTDNTGSEEANKRISTKRADAVKAALGKAGANVSSIETEGFGPAFPACPANDTPECKKQNRRISVRLTAK